MGPDPLVDEKNVDVSHDCVLALPEIPDNIYSIEKLHETPWIE